MRLFEHARAYTGTAFRHQGRDAATGIDCIGLVAIALRDAGYPYSEATAADYSRDPHEGLLEARLEALFGPPLPLSEMQADDIAVIRYGRQLRHVGIVGEWLYDGVPHLTLIHADSRIAKGSVEAGKVVEHRIDEGWMGRKRPHIGAVYRPRVG